MSDQIKLDPTTLLTTVADTQTAISGIDVNLDEWTSLGEKSSALEAFATQYVELESAMALFQQLLQKDMTSIAQIGDEFVREDYNLAKLWK